MLKLIASHPATTVVFGRSALSRTFRISLLLHAGILGLLVLFTTRPPGFLETPLRVRILEAPAPSPAPAPAPETSAPAPAKPPNPLPQSRPTIPPARGQLPAEKFIPRSIPPLDKPAAPVPPVHVTPPVPAAPPAAAVPPAPAVPPASAPPSPQVAARPAPEVSAPAPQAGPPVAQRERLKEPPPAAEGRGGGLVLGGPRDWPFRPAPGGSSSSENRPTRPSLRDQIASLGTGLSDDVEGKHTISLDDRRPEYRDYVDLLKRRIQREWGYPEEARQLGLIGELVLIFTINKEGSLLNLRLVQSSGFPILDNEAMRAVRAAAPFDPLLPGMGSDTWNVRGAFYYLGPRYR